MSDQDQVKPYHAKDAAPGKEAADVVAEVLKHAAEREEAAKKRTTPKGPPKWMLPLTVNLGVLALYFLIAQPDWIIVNPNQDPRTTAVATTQARQALYMDGIMRIEMFRQANDGRLPGTLEEAGSTYLASEGATYSVQPDSSYILIYRLDGTAEITFDSATDDPAAFSGPIQIGG